MKTASPPVPYSEGLQPLLCSPKGFHPIKVPMTERFNIGNHLGLNMTRHTDAYGMDEGTHALKNLSHLRAYRKDDTPPLSSETLSFYSKNNMTYLCSFKDLTVSELEYMNELLEANMDYFLQPRSVGTYSEGKFDHDLYIKIEPKHMIQFTLSWLLA